MSPTFTPTKPRSFKKSTFHRRAVGCRVTRIKEPDCRIVRALTSGKPRDREPPYSGGALQKDNKTEKARLRKGATLGGRQKKGDESQEEP